MCPRFENVSAGRGCCVSRSVWLQALPDGLRLAHKTTCYQMSVPNGLKWLPHWPSLSLSLSPQIFQEFPITQVSGHPLPKTPLVIPEIFQWLAVILVISSLCEMHDWKSGFMKKKSLAICVQHPALHCPVLYPWDPCCLCSDNKLYRMMWRCLWIMKIERLWV